MQTTKPKLKTSKNIEPLDDVVKSGRKPISLGRLWLFLRNSNNWETGKTIDEIAGEIYGEKSYHAKCKSRTLIHYLRKRLSRELKERYGVNIVHPLFSSKPVANTHRKYFLHVSREDIDRIDLFFEKLERGIERTHEGVKNSREMLPRIKRVKLNVEASA